MAESAQFSVEVIYALPHRQELVRLRLPAGCTAQQAIEASGFLQRYPEIDLKRGKFGVYGKLVRTDTPLRDRDRVEIYRPLLADPKEVRKKRAEEGRVTKKGGDAELPP